MDKINTDNNNNKLAIVKIGYRKKVVCIVLSKSNKFHDSYNVYADRKFYCLHKHQINFL
jgi:hypothetical protein